MLRFYAEIVEQETEVLEDWGYLHTILRVGRRASDPRLLLRLGAAPVAPGPGSVLAAGEDARVPVRNVRLDAVTVRPDGPEDLRPCDVSAICPHLSSLLRMDGHGIRGTAGARHPGPP